jgi:glycosyltransferase involved in cell wall biosynthesis
VSFLGLIPYEDVLNLIYFSKALINPSFFEGWSSTVEEAKSIGTLSIISDIPIHREQSPKNVIYFDPNDSVNLAEILENILLNGNKYLKIPINNVLEDLELRTLKFGNELIDYYTNHID